LPAPIPHHRAGKIAEVLPCIFPRSLAEVSHCLLHFQDFQNTCRSHQNEKIGVKGSEKIISGKCVQDAPFPAEQSAKNKYPSPAVLSGNDHRFRG
jgi:hypothetical protein